MTLIIGFKYKGTAIIGADTQLSHYNGVNEIINRTIINKMDQYNNGLLLSYLGKWDVSNEDKLTELRNELKVRKNKIPFIYRYMKYLNKDALIIGFKSLGLLWSLVIKGSENSTINRLKFKKNYFYFNEPNSKIPNHISIESRINQFLNNTYTQLENYLFTINNVILSEIIQGKDLDIKGLFVNNNLNSVGGYVTLNILQKKKKNILRFFYKSNNYCLYKYYKNDLLLDKISNPFMLGRNSKEILVIDNLAMIFKSIMDEENEGIKLNLINWIKLQIKYIEENNLITCYLLRLIVIHINNIGKLNIDDIECPDDFIIANDYDLEFSECKLFFD